MLYKVNEPNIYEYQNMLIFPHIMPDGDAIGTASALYHALTKIGKNPMIVLNDELPYDLKFLNEDITMYNSDYIILNEIEYDICISVDVSSIDRLGIREELIGDRPLWNIDHHKTNALFGDYQSVEGGLSSACEVLYSVLERMNISIDEKIATALYTGLSSDTGSFKYSTTTSKTHIVASDLIEKGADVQKVVKNLYMSKPLEKIKLETEVMSNASFHNDGKIALAIVTEEMVLNNNANMNMTDGIVEMLRDIDGVEISCFIKQKSQGVKISLRSKGNCDVAMLALSRGGGGHKRAAGFEIEKIYIEDAKEDMKDTLFNLLNGKCHE